MAINLIDKIEPKNDAFTGLVDADQVIGDGVTNVIPDAAISESSVTQHEAALTHDNLIGAGLDVRNDDFTLYVDAAGDDSNDGSIGSPIRSMAEMIKRLPVMGDRVIVQFSAGQFPLPNQYSATDSWTRTLLGSGGRVELLGTVNEIEAFTLSSVTGNTITVSGDPEWVEDSLSDKWVRWQYSGTTIQYYRGWKIISNTSNTITVASSKNFGGGVTSFPVAGTTLYVAENATHITPPDSGTLPANFWSYFYYTGELEFRNINFDASVYTGWQGPVAMGGATGKFWYCDFQGYTALAISGGASLSVSNCYFKNCGCAIGAGYYSVINGDNYFESCSSVLNITGGQVFFNHGCMCWFKNCSLGVEIQNYGVLDDGSIGYWLSGTNSVYVRNDVAGFYLKVTQPMMYKGDGGNTGFSTNVFQANTNHGHQCKFRLYNSESATLGPDATFFNIEGNTLSLTDYVAGGKGIEFPNGNIISG